MKFRASKYNYYVPRSRGYLVYNTLYQGMAQIGEEDFQRIQAGQAERLDEKALQDLCEHGFLVPASLDEKKAYDTLRHYMESNIEGTDYVIAVTSACNAGCDYCYEKGVEPSYMKKDCADAILNKISTGDAKEIKINWFGGEPLLHVPMIRYLSNQLRERKISFTSSIVTNGLLFTEELAAEAIKDWNLQSAQIPLDGLYDEYNAIKRYSGGVKNPFETVISNIGMLMQAKIQVAVRININRRNAGKMTDIISYLKKKFPLEDKLLVYVAFLTGTDAGEAFTEEEKKELTRQMFDALPMYSQLYFQGCLNEYPVLTACMREGHNSYCVDADGMVCRCEQYVGRHHGVSILGDEEVPVDYKVGAACGDCVFYPKCLGGCMADWLEGDCGCCRERYLIPVLLEDL